MHGEGPAPTLTAVRRSRPGRVALEIDGRPWRVVPDDVVVRCGLRAGLELGRPLLRDLRRELRRSEALATAVRTVSRRDISAVRLRQRLDARGINSQEAEAAVETLSAAGVVDDDRLARSRARALAERGWGDAAVAARLEQEGLPSQAVTGALAEIPAEHERAAKLGARTPDRRALWRLLARRGFAPETIEEIVGPLDDPR
jgi:regulatory protein